MNKQKKLTIYNCVMYLLIALIVMSLISGTYYHKSSKKLVNDKTNDFRNKYISNDKLFCEEFLCQEDEIPSYKEISKTTLAKLEGIYNRTFDSHFGEKVSNCYCSKRGLGQNSTLTNHYIFGHTEYGTIDIYSFRLRN